jgi:hypothetical protein
MRTDLATRRLMQHKPIKTSAPDKPFACVLEFRQI